MREQAHIFGGEYFEDSPRDAAVSTFSMQHGDVLVLATDGVFDNLNNQDILKIVTGRMLTTGAWAASSTNAAIRPSAELRALTAPGGLHQSSSSSPSSAPSSPSSSSSPSSAPSSQSSSSSPSSTPSSPSSSSSPSSTPSSLSSPSSSPPSVSPTPHLKSHHTLQALIAASIVGEAKLASIDMRRDGPFAKEAQRYYPGHWYRGGKVDDICALVIIAIEH